MSKKKSVIKFEEYQNWLKVEKILQNINTMLPELKNDPNSKVNDKLMLKTSKSQKSQKAHRK